MLVMAVMLLFFYGFVNKNLTVTERIPPDLIQPLKAVRSICRTCRGQLHDLSIRLPVHIFHVQIIRFGAIGIDMRDVRLLQQRTDVVRYDIADRAVAGARNLTGCDHIPHRDFMPQ